MFGLQLTLNQLAISALTSMLVNFGRIQVSLVSESYTDKRLLETYENKSFSSHNLHGKNLYRW